MKKRNYLIAIITGIIVGIITVIGQKYLSGNLNFLVNSASMWLIPTFFIPYFLKTDSKDSIIISMTILIFCVLGYYIFEAIIHSHTFEFSTSVILWLLCAIAGGIVFGLGANYSRTKNGKLKLLSMNLLPAVFLSEPLYKLINISAYSNVILDIIVQIIIGLILYGIINFKESHKLKNILSCIFLTVLGILGFFTLSALSKIL